MFRFRKKPAPPPDSRAKRMAAVAARGALLGAAAAAKASADALKWAAERKQPPPAPPKVEPVPVFVVSPPPAILLTRPGKPAKPDRKSHVLPVLAGALVVAVVMAATSGRRSERSAAEPPAPQNMARLSPSRLTDYAADNGVLGGAKAAMAALEKSAQTKLVQVPQPVPPPVPLPPLPVIVPREVEPMVRATISFAEAKAAPPKTAVKLTGVRSAAPHTRKEDALADALIEARTKLGEQFRKLDPPLDLTPTATQVKEFVRADTEVAATAEDKAAWEAAGLDANRLWVAVDVEVSEAQVRQLRGDRRLAGNAPLFLLPALLAGGLWGFLRLDAATKGHLTGWLVAAVGGLVIAAATVAALVAPW